MKYTKHIVVKTNLRAGNCDEVAAENAAASVNNAILNNGDVAGTAAGLVNLLSGCTDETPME
jgi:hypothetical protein